MVLKTINSGYNLGDLREREEVMVGNFGLFVLYRSQNGRAEFITATPHGNIETLTCGALENRLNLTTMPDIRILCKYNGKEYEQRRRFLEA